ncbi:ricin-type beta-trefoil lectin domain protein [Streptomyces sp. 049-1]|uniref:ricin-type beta-trefoil lectin domain protein n=1 Tax=Streptomyces sp. 049-1 TaxID=2789264 RepID=UPI0039808F78
MLLHVIVSVSVVGSVIAVVESADRNSKVTGGDPAAEALNVADDMTCWATHYGAEIPPHSYTASGELFDLHAMTAATSLSRSPQLPFGTRVKVQNQANGETVTVRINDRGTFAATPEEPKCLDLSDGAFSKLGRINPDPGHFTVRITVLDGAGTPSEAATPSPSSVGASSSGEQSEPSLSTPDPAPITTSTSLYRPGEQGTAGETVTGLRGLCVDARDEPGAAAAPVTLNECDGATSQAWTFPPDGTVRAMGLCLTALGADHAQGAPVGLERCHGAVSTKWRMGPDGSLIDLGSGLCLDAKDKRTSAGTPLQVWTCWGGGNQKWRRS